MNRTEFLKGMEELGFTPTLFKRDGDSGVYYSCTSVINGLSINSQGQLPASENDDHTPLLVSNGHMLFYQIGQVLWHGNA